MRLPLPLAAVSLLWCQSPALAASETESGPFAGSIRVYMTPSEARDKMFPAASFKREIKVIPAAAKDELVRGVGGPIVADSLEVWLAYAGDGSFSGYTLIAEEIGKFRPITFMVGISPDFRVTAAAVLVYRESRGGEVRRSRFLRQYKGKSTADPIRINRDIINITGATLSVRALNFGVRKLVNLTEFLYSPALTAPVAADSLPQSG